jgi:uncharacterized protein YfaS (alpha-2-macroglobulin family)
VAISTEPLPYVEAVPDPQLPAWIEQISPLGQSEPLAQIRIRFGEPLIPLEILGSDRQQDLLERFTLEPPIPGQFRFLTPRMVGFQAERALPQATRFKVTLKAGLTDLADHQLGQDLVWTFNTAPIELSDLPQTQPEYDWQPPDYFDLDPTFTVTANTALDQKSLQEHLALVAQGTGQTVGLNVTLEEETAQWLANTPAAQFDPSQRPWIYTLEPRGSLDKATAYELQFNPGILPAGGNLATEAVLSSLVETYSPFGFQELLYQGAADAGGAYSRFVNGLAQLQFNNPLDRASIDANLSLDPAPREDIPLAQAYEGDAYFDLNPWALEPDTRYTITLGPDLMDGFGQRLGETLTLTYDTGDAVADLWAPDGLNIFPTGQNIALNVSAVNLPDGGYKAAFKSLEPKDLINIDPDYFHGYQEAFLPPIDQWQTINVDAAPNETIASEIPIQAKLGKATGLLAYGIQGRTSNYQDSGQEYWNEPVFYGLVELTNLGIFAQWFPDSGLVRVHHLDTGNPVGGATIELYVSDPDATLSNNNRPCATGRTDATGSWNPTRAVLQTCYDRSRSIETNDDTAGPGLVVIAKEGQDWAFTRTAPYSGSYGFGTYTNWHNGQVLRRGLIFSDRELYQPGENAWFTVATHYFQQGQIEADQNQTYKVLLRTPDGETINLGERNTNEFGTFAIEWNLPANQSLGNYRIEAQRKNNPDDAYPNLYGDFEVAEFKPPNFKVDLTLDKAFASPQETVNAQVQGQYLFGAPLDGGNLAYFVTRQPAEDFAPAGWDGFAFGPQWFWPQEPPSVEPDVLQTEVVLDATGNASQVINVSESLPFPMVYRVDAEVRDVSNLAVGSSKLFTALPSDRLIGLRSKFVAQAGEALDVEVIVTDPQGQVQRGENVTVQLEKMDYSYARRVVAGSSSDRNQVTYTLVDEVKLKSGAQAQTVQLTPTESGSYRIRANFTGSNSEATVSDRQIWATGSGSVFWGSRDQDRLEIKLDKDTYKPGETATVLLQSPYETGELYFSVVRDRPLYQRVVQVQGGAPQIKFEVTPDMLPNAAVEAVLVRQGQPLDQVEPGTVDGLVRIGLKRFNLDLNSQYLNLELQPQQPELQPGQQQRVKLKLTDQNNKPVQGQVTLMVVNEAVLQLTGYRPPDLVDAVYADQPIATNFSDNRLDVVLATPASPLEKGWGYGGGFSAGGADTETRRDFRPLAYFNPSVLTNNRGEATVNFSLPDDLTTWRVMGVSVANDAQAGWEFGNGEATFLTNLPLLANPILPQFARSGDELSLGLAVTNTSDKQGQLKIQGNLGEGLNFDKSRTPKTLEDKLTLDSGTTAFRYPITVTDAADSTVRFAIQLDRLQDAFSLPLKVRGATITEQVVESGVTESQAVIPLEVSRQVDRSAGGLDISIASTLIPEIQAPARRVFDPDRLALLEPIASQLLIAADLQLLGQAYGQSFAQFDPPEQASQALAQLVKLQRADGGFGFWSRAERSDPWVTPYAAEAIAQAQAAGFSVDPDLLVDLRGYLDQLVTNPAQAKVCDESDLCKAEMRLEALVALGALGDQRSDFVFDIYQQQADLDPISRLKLARYLAQLPNWQGEAQTLSQELWETVYDTGRNAQLNLPQFWSWFNAPPVLQAQTLQLFVTESGDLELGDRLLRGLLALRRDGDWGSSYYNAQALDALVAYTQAQPANGNFQAQVQLGRQVLLQEQLDDRDRPSTDLVIPMADLPQGQSDLILQKSGQGNLHYLASYRYRLQGQQPGRFNGLRITRQLRPANESVVLAQQGLFGTDQAVTVQPGQVFDLGLELITDHPIDHLVITDPLPAGFEAVDSDFQTNVATYQAARDSWQLSYEQIYADRVVAYGDHLEAGVYELHYLVRSVTPGTFRWPGAEAHLQYAPEEFGRTVSTVLKVEDS